MTRKTRYCFVFFLVMSQVNAAVPAHAQELSEQEVLDAVLSEDSAADAQEPVRLPIPSTPVAKHFRFSEGAPPTVHPTAAPPAEILEMVKEVEASLKVEEQKELTDEELMEAFEPPNLEECATSDTISENLEAELPPGLESDDAPSFDILFIAAKELPSDYEERFGLSTIVVPVDNSSPNEGWGMVATYGVTCLPYRMRMQGGRVYIDTGINALKNYVNGPKGDLHPELKLLEKEKKKARS